MNNWGSVDGFSIEVLQPLLFRYPDEMLQLLRRWNGAESLWKRRASVVVFTRRVGKTGRFTEEALELCNGLIWDAEDYVRKGVDWALKDTMRAEEESAGVREGVEAKKGIISNNPVRDTRFEGNRAQSNPEFENTEFVSLV